MAIFPSAGALDRSGRAALLLLLALTALSRLLTAERHLSGLDPGNYMLGMQSYSIAEERPHPPGYPVYIALCKGAAWVAGDDHTGILIVVVLCSVAAVLFIYLPARQWIGERYALPCAALFAFNPLFWYYGSVTENYAFDAMIGSAVILLFLKARKRWWLPAGIVVGLALGVRGTSLLLLAPAYLYIVVSRFGKSEITIADLLLFVVGAVVGVAAWLPVVIGLEGGVDAYLRSASNLSTSSDGTFVGNVAGFVITTAWTLNLGAIYLAVGGMRLIRSARSGRGNRRAGVIMLLWIIPPSLFFLLVIYTKGYLLLILPALYLLMMRCIAAEPSQRTRRGIYATLMGTGLAVFLLVPYISPPPFTTLAPRNRSTGQRASSVIGRTLSVYVPSLARIRANDAQVESATVMIGRGVSVGRDSTLVVLDPAGRQFINARILQVYMPQVRFAEPGIRNDRMVTYFQGIDKEERFGDRAAFDRPRILLLTHAGLAEKYRDLGGRPIGEDHYFAMLEFPASKGIALRARMEELFTRWEMEGDPRAHDVK